MCPRKTIPDIINRNLKKDELILIIFVTNISDTTGHPITLFKFPLHATSVPALPGEIGTSKIVHFYSKIVHFYSRSIILLKVDYILSLFKTDYLIKIIHIKHILSRFLSHWLTVYPIDQLSNCLQKTFEISAFCVNTGMQMLSPFTDSGVDNVLLQTSTSRFLSSTFLSGVRQTRCCVTAQTD